MVINDDKYVKQRVMMIIRVLQVFISTVLAVMNLSDRR